MIWQAYPVITDTPVAFFWFLRIDVFCQIFVFDKIWIT